MALIQGDRLPTLTGARVHLRWLVAGDVSALHEVFSDPEVMRYWSRTPFTDAGHEEARALLASIERAFTSQTLFQWGIARRADDRIVGTCTLAHVDASNRRAELGYALGRAHWGHGLMGEALALLLSFAFGDLGLRRLEADVPGRVLEALVSPASSTHPGDPWTPVRLGAYVVNRLQRRGRACLRPTPTRATACSPRA
jgi:ribosomal-protein-alanine N-acetyltransferase